MPEGGGGAVAVARDRVANARHARGSIALIAHFLDLLARELAGTALDRVLDPVGRHVDLTSLLHREAQPEVAVGVTAALLGRDRDLPAGARERLSTLRLDHCFLALHTVP